MRTFALFVILFATGAAHADAAGDQALAAVDAALNRARTHIFEYDVVTQEPGRGEKKLGLVVHLKGDKRLTEFTAPADLKGTKVLVNSPTEMYAFLPAFGKVRRIASHTSDQSAFGMAFSQDDLATQKYGGDYGATIKAQSDTALELVLVPRPGRSAPYSKIEMTVEKERSLPTELRYFTGSGTLWKTETRTGYQCKEQVCVPRELKMVDHAKGGMWTRITTRVWKLNESVDDGLLSKRTLGQ